MTITSVLHKECKQNFKDGNCLHNSTDTHHKKMLTDCRNV